MTISEEMVAAMHTYLAALHTDSDADLDDSDRQFLALLKADRIEGLGELLLAAFTVVARRRFSPAWSPAEIVRFVADVRSSSDEMAALLAPSAAENQLRLALGARIAPFPDMEARGRAQMLLLGALTRDYTPHDLAAMLSDARVLAEKSITTTVDLYGHLVPEASARARNALDGAFAAARAKAAGTPRAGACNRCAKGPGSRQEAAGQKDKKG